MPVDYYKKQEKLIDLDFTKFLIILITVFVTVVIPVQVITYVRQNPDELGNAIASLTDRNQNTSKTNNTTATTQNNNSGRVAGLSTSASSSGDSVLGIFGEINLKSKSSQYLILGIFFIGTSVFIIGYLLSTEVKPKKKHYYAEKKFKY